jgi:hypothetical protein
MSPANETLHCRFCSSRTRAAQRFSHLLTRGFDLQDGQASDAEGAAGGAQQRDELRATQLHVREQVCCEAQ